MKPILLTALALTASTTLVDGLITTSPAVAQACGAPACVYDMDTHTWIPDPSYVSPTITPATPPPPPPPPRPSVGGVNTADGPTLGSDNTCPACTSIPNRYSIPPVLPNVSLPDLSPETVPRTTAQPRPAPDISLPDLRPETVATPQVQPSPPLSANESPVTSEPVSTPRTQPQPVARPNPPTARNPQPSTTQPQRSQGDNATPTANSGTPSNAPTGNNAAPPSQNLTTGNNATNPSAPPPQPAPTPNRSDRRDSLPPEPFLRETLTPNPTARNPISHLWWVLGTGGGLAALGGGGYQGHRMRQNRIKTQQANAAAALSNLSFNLFSNPPAAKQEVKTPGPLTPNIAMAVQLHRDSGRQRLEAPGGLVDLGGLGAPTQSAAFSPASSPLSNNAPSLNITSA